MLRSSWSDNEGREWCSLEDFFDMCLRTTFDKTRVRKCVATTRTSNTTKNLWRGECRNREQPCFYLFFDQRPRNYVIVVIWSIFYTITLFSFILHIFAMKTFNKHWTNKGRREDEMIIIWILKPWHYFAYYLNAYYLICDKRYLFFNFFSFSFERKVHERYIEIELIPYLRFVWKSIFQCSWLFHDEKTSFFALVGRREIGLDRMSWYGKNSRS